MIASSTTRLGIGLIIKEHFLLFTFFYFSTLENNNELIKCKISKTSMTGSGWGSGWGRPNIDAIIP